MGAIRKTQQKLFYSDFSRTLDRTKDFNEQIEHVENGLKNFERIRDWILENGQLLHSSV
jgi:hypothetical protein